VYLPRYWNQMPYAVEGGEQGAGLVAGQNDGDVGRPLGMHEVAQPGELAAENFLIEEQQRGERLVLGRRADVGAGRQVRQIGANLRLAHGLGVSLVVK
jgi:hypothetical protein